MKKKLFVLFVTMLSLCVSSVSAHDFEYNGIYYNINEEISGNQLVSVTYKGNSYYEYTNEYSGDIIIPVAFFYNDVNCIVTGITDNAFRDCTTLKSVQFGEEAFSFAFSLHFGEGIFKNCTNLTTVRFSKASKEQYAITDVFIPWIGREMFYDCSNLTSFSIPHGVSFVEYRAFYGCSKLKTIVIPNTVTDIDLYDCTGLTNVTVKSEQPWNLNCYIPNKEKVTLYVPAGSKAAYESAEFWKDFKEIVEMRDIVFAEDRIETTCIKYWDTNNDWKLNEEEAAAVTEINNEFTYYANISSFDELKYFTGLKKIGDEAFYHCSEMNSITIPVGVTSIGNDAFKECYNLKDYNRIVDLKKWCEEGDKITYGEGESNPMRTNIIYGGINRELHLFSDYDTEIKDLVIPDGISSICGSAFRGYSGLTSVTIGNSVKSIASGAFSDCSNLASVSIGNSVINIDRNPFSSCSSLNSILVEDGNSIFDSRNDCNAIIRKSDNTLIAGCMSTVIPSNVTCIGNYAFYSCKALTTMYIPESVTSIDSYAFAFCSGLTALYIPNNVTNIGSYSFNYCSSLTSVTLPNSVTSIGNYAFAYCTGLTSVIMENSTPVTIYPNTFHNCSNAILYVPKGSKAAYEAADYWKDFKLIIEMDGSLEIPKCATPTIQVVDGTLNFSCETEGVTYKARYTYDSGNTDIEDDKMVLAGSIVCHVTVYAIREGYQDSDAATIDIKVDWGKQGDTNKDGKVTITDAVSVVNIILNNGEATAPAMESPAVEVPEVGEPE